MKKYVSATVSLPRLVVVDNYDSFTHNLVQMFVLYELDINVYRADRISVGSVFALEPDYILVSPGPRDPAHAGISIEVIRAAAGKIPVLGVCLGMQCMNEAFGGKTVRAPLPVHGKTSPVLHDDTGVFSGIPSPFTAARYHSLAVDPCGTGLAVNARADDGVIMGLWHPGKKLFGVQFHPESFMTPRGFGIVENFLKSGPHAVSVQAARAVRRFSRVMVRKNMPVKDTCRSGDVFHAMEQGA